VSSGEVDHDPPGSTKVTAKATSGVRGRYGMSKCRKGNDENRKERRGGKGLFSSERDQGGNLTQGENGWTEGKRGK